MIEKMRRCLGCRRYFLSDSPANRFCKLCKKRRGQLKGSFEPLDPDHLPLPIAREIRYRYYGVEVPAAEQPARNCPAFSPAARAARPRRQKAVPAPAAPLPAPVPILPFIAGSRAPAWGMEPPRGI